MSIDLCVSLKSFFQKHPDLEQKKDFDKLGLHLKQNILLDQV